MSIPAPRDSSTRAADSDRIQVAQLLTDAAAQGRLELSEFEARLAKAYAADTYEELNALSADLPGIANTRRGACKPAPATVLLAIMTGFERRGRWNVPRKLTTFSFWGGGVIDLRYADFTSPTVLIKAYSIMAGQTILVPPEANVTIKGSGLMGTFDHISETGAPGAPQVTITGLALWGRVAIRRRRRGRKHPGGSFTVGEEQ